MASSDSTRPLADLLAEAGAAANLLGRLTVLRDCRHKVTAPLRFAASSGLHSFAASSGTDPLDADLYTSFSIPPTAAVDYLRNLTPVTRDLFDQLSKQLKAEAFTLAGASDDRLVQRIRDQLADVISAGGTRQDFAQVLDKLRRAPEGSGLGAIDVDGVFQGATHRSYAAGRYTQMTDDSVVQALPFWQYWTVGDDRVRPSHRALDKFCALSSDPVWLKIYAPWDYGCRCSVVPITAAEAPEGSSEGGVLRLPLLATEALATCRYHGILG